ncbi:hypothetical protein [Acidovorax sp. 56]|uniref:hypothetical protein n=1 Tax=Acidovorax sp. 56 TaxID=2035205 RepID=UPI0011788416|nr:hypothetical protein [Acidovorax sp. 56]
MIPVSTAKLAPGDFCFIPRSDGKFVPFAFLCGAQGKKSYFYGGLLDAVVEHASTDELPPSLAVKHFALLHIGCFKENNTPIVGNVAAHIGSSALQELESKTKEFSVGAISSVWGHRTIVKYAEGVGT